MADENTEQTNDQQAQPQPQPNGADGNQVSNQNLDTDDAANSGKEAGDDVNWDFMKGLWDGGEPAKAEPSTEDSPDTSQSASQTEESETPEDKGEEVEATDEAEPEAEPEQPSADPESQQAYQKQLREYEQKLYNTYLDTFKKELSSEEYVEALQQEPEKVLPEFAAKLAMTVRQQLGAEIMQHVPQMSLQTVLQHVRHKGAENKLTKSFPGLDMKNEKHKQTVEMVAQVFRQKKPDASQDEAIQAVGQMASQMLGLDMPEQKDEKPEPSSEPSQAPEKPYRPARAAGSASPQPSLEDNLAGKNKKNDDSLDDLWNFVEESGFDF